MNILVIWTSDDFFWQNLYGTLFRELGEQHEASPFFAHILDILGAILQEVGDVLHFSVC